MKNLLFVTVGTSALDAAGRMRDDLAKGSDCAVDRARLGELETLAASVRDYKNDRTASQSEKGERIFAPLLALHRAFWVRERPLANPKMSRETSAELFTTAALLDELNGGVPPLAMDRIVLLIPGTPEGKLAGRIVQEIMELPEYQDRRGQPRVTRHETPDISQKGAIESLPDEILKTVALHRGPENNRVFFNATAGFGVTGILIGMLAARHGYRVYYQQERMDKPFFISPNLNIDRTPGTWILDR
jgi:putative CRISPR-associated protein (TIGR02619 family)